MKPIAPHYWNNTGVKGSTDLMENFIKERYEQNIQESLHNQDLPGGGIPIGSFGSQTCGLGDRYPLRGMKPSFLM